MNTKNHSNVEHIGFAKLWASIYVYCYLVKVCRGLFFIYYVISKLFFHIQNDNCRKTNFISIV